MAELVGKVAIITGTVFLFINQTYNRVLTLASRPGARGFVGLSLLLKSNKKILLETMFWGNFWQSGPHDPSQNFYGSSMLY